MNFSSLMTCRRYNKATGELLGTFNSNTRSLRLTEEQDVKELEYKFKISR